MATEITTKPPGAEDDEEWLYGNSENAENKEPAAPGTGPPGELPPPKEREEGEMSGDEQNQTQDKDDDDDSDDDDDVQVTIGDIKAFPMNNAGPNLFKPGSTYQKQPVTAGQKITTTTPGVKGVDVEMEGNINGVNVFEFSLDSLRDEEKPWRKPGADITDYFNYGFNEESWRKYCQKQNRLRAENGCAVPRAFASMGTGSVGNVVRVETSDMAPPGMSSSNRQSSKSSFSHQPSGTIAVLGSTTASRRPADEEMNDVQQIGSIGGDEMKTSMQGMPPGVPPMGVPPPDYSMPPPGMPPIPPSFAPNVPPPGMPVPPPNMFNPPPAVPPFFPPHVPPPQDNRSFGERPPYSFESTPTHSTYSDAHSKSNWESRERDSYRDRWDYKRDRSPGSDYTSRDYYRGRDTDRSRSDRDRSRSRERDRRHRDRDRDDKKSKSSRKIKDEPDDSDYYKSSSSSSKHKKSKRSKRDKDDDSEDASGT